MKPALLILAAGMGSRYGGLKQTEPFGPSGETILEYSVFDAIRAGFGKVVFVIRQSFADEFTARFAPKLRGRIEMECVCQELDRLPSGYALPVGREKPWGTGHAILMAKDVIKEPFAAINADDFYGAQAFRTMADFLIHAATPDTFGMVGYRLDNTLSPFGTVARGVCRTNAAGFLTRITEMVKIARTDTGIRDQDTDTPLEPDTPVSMNFWGFHPALFAHLERLFIRFLDDKLNVPKAEFYIPSAVFELIKCGAVQTRVLAADSPWFGVTYPQDRPYVVEQIGRLVGEGYYPEALWP
ncbi:MAG: nucleotidyltransferase [Bacteroidales bacterium]|jgi:hypothetical protein|nr:nucleotidyltransferase [Bacteroidales bacterium]